MLSVPLRLITVVLFLTISGVLLHALNTQPASQQTKQSASDETEEYAHPEEYFRLHQSIRTPSGERVPTYPPNYRVKELLKAYNVSSTASLGKQTVADPLPWIERGPLNVSGRARVILADPADPSLDTWYVGSASGGVWKTDNRGQSWTNLTNSLTNLATTTLAIPTSSPSIIYAGTGEGYGRSLVYGQGIWKSEDSGSSWTQLTSTAEDTRFTNTMRVIVDPDNPDLVIAAAASGVRNASLSESSYLFRSTDGGASWTQTYQSDGTLFGGRVEQVIASPASFNVQYASVNSREVLKSTDGGQTWQEVFTAPSDVRRMELAIAPSNPNWVYIAAQVSPANARLYVSTDAGANWTLTRARNGNNINWMGQQGWYGNAIAVHPYDETTVYTGGIDLMEITVDGDLRTAVTPVTDAYNQYIGVNAKGVHVDQQGLTMVPINETTGEFLFLNANDGGISFSLDAGDTFTQTGETLSQAPGGRGTTNLPLRGLNTTQFYGVDKMNGANRYVGGTQDNGSWQSPFNPAISTRWLSTTGGDGFEMAWHYRKPTNMISTIQFNVFLKSTDSGITWRSLNVPGVSGPFVTRLAKSNQDPDLLFAVDSLGVIISEDFGDSWELIEPEGWAFTTTPRNSIPRISLASPDVVWAGSHLIGDSTLFVSTDGASTFTQTEPYAAVDMGPISGLSTHPIDPNTAFASFSYANKPKILRTTDLGQTWEDITGYGTGTASTNGFPDVATYSVLVMPFDENIIWAGTEIGLFESVDGGVSWQLAQNGLPSVSIWQMRIVNDEVVLATHGRGIWSVSLSELEGYEPLPYPLRPIITNERVSASNVVSFSLFLRQPADSTVIELDNVPVRTLAANADTSMQQVSVAIDVNATRTLPLSAVSYVDGERFTSRIRSIQVFRTFEPQASFTTDFSVDADAFALDGFVVETPSGFSNEALHTRHPYGDNLQHTARLLVPIIVSADNPYILYDDIALVEEGTPNSRFGDSQFFDYVILEGSNNGITWSPLADGYDARFNPAWQQALDRGENGTAALFTSHEVNLLNTFAPGEQIELRFRLFADQNVNGWGWAIDNLSIQEALPTATEETASPHSFSLYQNYPNPFREQTTIQYSLATPSPVELTVYDMLGRRVETLVSSSVLPAGMHEFNWTGMDVASGTYHLVLESNEGRRTMTLVKL